MKFGTIVGVIGGALVAGPAGAIAGAKLGDSDAAADALRVTKKFVSGFGEVIEVAGHTIVDAVEDIGKALAWLIEGMIGIRPLRPSERVIAERVFNKSIPLDRIVICSLDGLGGRPFTLPGFMVNRAVALIPGMGPPLSFLATLASLDEKYVLFLGGDGYRDSINWNRGQGKMFPAQTLVHELTHVWQGHHKFFAWDYVLNSLSNQCACMVTGGSAYAYTTGKQWWEYEAEQQASIVEDWYVLTNGADPNVDPERHGREPYIRYNIRPGRINARAVWPPYNSREILASAKQLEAEGRREMSLGPWFAKIGGQAKIDASRQMQFGAKQLSRQEIIDQARVYERDGRILLGTRLPQNIIQGNALLQVARAMLDVAANPATFI